MKRQEYQNGTGGIAPFGAVLILFIGVGNAGIRFQSINEPLFLLGKALAGAVGSDHWAVDMAGIDPVIGHRFLIRFMVHKNLVDQCQGEPLFDIVFDVVPQAGAAVDDGFEAGLSKKGVPYMVRTLVFQQRKNVAAEL